MPGDIRADLEQALPVLKDARLLDAVVDYLVTGRAQPVQLQNNFSVADNCANAILLMLMLGRDHDVDYYTKVMRAHVHPCPPPEPRDTHEPPSTPS